MGYRKACQYIDSWHAHERAFAHSLYHDHLRPLRHLRQEAVLWCFTGMMLLASAAITAVRFFREDPYLVAVSAGSSCVLALTCFLLARRRVAQRRLKRNCLVNLHMNCKQMVPPTRHAAELANGRYGEQIFWQVVAGLRYADRTIPPNHKIEAMLQQRV